MLRFSIGLVAALSFICFVFIGLWLSFQIQLPETSKQPWVTRKQVHMGTFIQISVPRVHQALLEPAFEIFADLDRKLSTYQPDSEVSRLNQIQQLKVSPKTLTVLRQSLALAQETDGAFDVTVGAWTKGAYKFGTDRPTVPQQEELKQVRSQVSWRNIMIVGDQVRLLNHAVIDLGGIGKGFAVDEVSAFFTKQGVDQGIIQASGDIHCLHPCVMGIREPVKGSQQALLRFRLRQPRMAISTSGTYERVVEEGKAHHLLDPTTGKPQRTFISLTLLAKGQQNARLDALATALSVMPFAKAQEFIQAQPNLGVFWITTQGEAQYNQVFRDLTTDWSWGEAKVDFKIKKMIEANSP